MWHNKEQGIGSLVQKFYGSTLSHLFCSLCFLSSKEWGQGGSKVKFQ